MMEPKVLFPTLEIAVVVGVENIEGKRTNGESTKASATTTNVFQKRGGQWLMILHQATPIRQP
jgi:ketosteroid isomerase-like protein